MNLDKLDSTILINIDNVVVKFKTICITQVKALVMSRWEMIFFTSINISSKLFKN